MLLTLFTHSLIMYTSFDFICSDLSLTIKLSVHSLARIHLLCLCMFVMPKNDTRRLEFKRLLTKFWYVSEAKMQDGTSLYLLPNSRDSPEDLNNRVPAKTDKKIIYFPVFHTPSLIYSTSQVDLLTPLCCQLTKSSATLHMSCSSTTCKYTQSIADQNAKYNFLNSSE